jgi:NAD-dependent DNA ligase
MLTVIEANKEIDNKFKNVCKTCGSKLTHVTEDYNICLNMFQCDDCNVYDDKGNIIVNM